MYQLIVCICEVLIRIRFRLGEQQYHDLSHGFHLEAYQNHQIEDLYTKSFIDVHSCYLLYLSDSTRAVIG